MVGYSRTTRMYPSFRRNAFLFGHMRAVKGKFKELT